MHRIKLNRRFVQQRPEGGWALRVTHRAKRGKKSACYRVACGCCKEHIDIYYDDDGEGLEIGGVNGSLQNWREILLPLLHAPINQGMRFKIQNAASLRRECARRLNKGETRLKVLNWLEQKFYSQQRDSQKKSEIRHWLRQLLPKRRGDRPAPRKRIRK